MSENIERFEQSVYHTYKTAKDGLIPWIDGVPRMTNPDGELVRTSLTNYARIVTAQRHKISLKEVKRIVWEQAEIARYEEQRKVHNNRVEKYYKNASKRFIAEREASAIKAATKRKRQR